MGNFQILIVLQSKSVNNVCKLIQLLGDESPWISWETSVSQLPPMKISGVATIRGSSDRDILKNYMQQCILQHFDCKVAFTPRLLQLASF